jgi:hypothetical protein
MYVLNFGETQAGHRTRLEARGVFEELRQAEIGTAHPESLGHFGDASAIFRLPQPVEDGFGGPRDCRKS